MQTNNEYDSLFDYYGRLYNVDPRLGKTVFHLESSGNPGTRDSSQGAQGGMQMLPSTAASLGVTNPRDMKQAIPAAMQYLAQGLEQTHTPAGALAYYHGGPDTAQWGPKTAAYVARGQSYFPQMTISGGADAVAPTPSADFNSRWGLTPTAPQPPAVSDDFAKRWGIAPPANDAEKPAAAPLPVPVASAPAQMGNSSIAANALGGDQFIPNGTSNPLSSAYAKTTNALAPAPNTTYGNILPFARDNGTGALRLAMPEAARGLVQGAADLAFGPSLGTVTPGGTNALASVVPGMMGSPAHIPGRFSLFPSSGGASTDAMGGLTPAGREANATAYNNPPPLQLGMAHPLASTSPGFVPPGTSSPLLPRIQQLIEADNQVAANKPAFVPPSSVTDVQGEVAPVRQPPNPLSATTPEATAANPLATGVAPKISPTASVAAQEAAETAAIPDRLPPAPLVPPLTQSAAETRADQLIRHFGVGKAVTENPDIVPGYLPKLAGLTNDPGIATLERGVQAVNPGPIGLRDQANQQAIRAFTERLQGTPEDVAAAQATRDAATTPLRDAAFANSSDVNPAPIVSQIDKILASPEGKRAAVQRTLANVRDSLFNGEGELETNPQMLYGVRKNLNDLLDPVAQKDNPQLQQAARQLLDIKSHLDDVIEQGAPGFQDYIDKYAELSKPIDAQRYLQSLNLTNAADNVRLQSVDSAIKSIERQQRMPGVQKATAVSEDQLAALNTLRNTLRMEQFSASAGKHLGSNTFQNLATNSLAGQVTGNPLVNVGLGGLGFASGGPLGSMVAAGASMGAHKVLDRAETMVRDAIVKRLLNHGGTGAAALADAAP